MQLPDILVATSSSGSLHVFSMGFAINQRSELRLSVALLLLYFYLVYITTYVYRRRKMVPRPIKFLVIEPSLILVSGCVGLASD